MYNTDKKEIIVLLCFTFAIMQSCCKNTEDTGQKIVIVSNDCDSIIYELPEKTTNTLLKMIADKKVSRCGLIHYEDNFSFSFPYDDKTLYTKRDSLLFSTTHTFLKLRNRFVPVISEFDNIFSNISRTPPYAINDFNFCFVSVNARGEFIEGFAY